MFLTAPSSSRTQVVDWLVQWFVLDLCEKLTFTRVQEFQIVKVVIVVTLVTLVTVLRIVTVMTVGTVVTVVTVVTEVMLMKKFALKKNVMKKKIL